MIFMSLLFPRSSSCPHVASLLFSTLVCVDFLLFLCMALGVSEKQRPRLKDNIVTYIFPYAVSRPMFLSFILANSTFLLTLLSVERKRERARDREGGAGLVRHGLVVSLFLLLPVSAGLMCHCYCRRLWVWSGLALYIEHWPG